MHDERYIFATPQCPPSLLCSELDPELCAPIHHGAWGAGLRVGRGSRAWFDGISANGVLKPLLFKGGVGVVSLGEALLFRFPFISVGTIPVR